MFCKIFKHGEGEANGIDYLMSAKDAQSKPRMPPAKLMRGNISTTKGLISQSVFAQKYTTGVLSWAESPDQVSQVILDEVMDSFQQMLGVGLAHDSLNWLWVQHRDKGRIELHWVVPNTELKSGKRFAAYFDRTDRARFRAWERLTNKKYSFADPSDPARRKDLRLSSNLPPCKVEAINLIHNVISALVSQKLIKNRDDIIQKLKDSGYLINRKGKDYLSIQDSKGQKLRLKGAFYEAGFNIKNQLDKIFLEKEFLDRNIQSLQDELNNQTEKRVAYIQTRHPSSNNINDLEIAPLTNQSLHKLNVLDSNLITEESEMKNDSTRKFAKRNIKSDGRIAQPTIRRVDEAINTFGLTTEIFHNSLQRFVDRVGRSIKHFKKSTSNRLTY